MLAPSTTRFVTFAFTHSLKELSCTLATLDAVARSETVRAATSDSPRLTRRQWLHAAFTSSGDHRRRTCDRRDDRHGCHWAHCVQRPSLVPAGADPLVH